MVEESTGFAPGEECAKCGGRCCRERGCSLSPDDLFRFVEKYFSKDIEKNSITDTEEDISKDTEKDISKDIKKDISKDIKNGISKDIKKDISKDTKKDSIKDSIKDTSHDFEDLSDKYKDSLKQVLLEILKDYEKGIFAIDSFNHNGEQIFFLRMRHKFFNFIGVDAFGECVALTDSGCSLKMEDRPKGGRFLKSSPDYRCHQEYSADMMAADWKPFYHILKEIWDEYEPVFEENGTFDECDRAYYEYIKRIGKHKNNL